MSLFRHFALGAWYYATLPWRGRARTRWTGGAPTTIFFYHRVADRFANPWTISNDEFERQINWLGKHFELISLEETQRRMTAGDATRPAVSITFDDGYAENCDRALPLLIERGIPCTYFVATRFVLNGEPFPHDVQAGRPLPVNTPEHLRRLADAGIEIGAHTRNHVDLGRVIDGDELRDEIAGSKQDLETMLDRRVRYFAFPYGLRSNLQDAAFGAAREAGYDGVCSAYGGYNVPGANPFHLQRFHGDPDFLRLKNWATVDPRKSRRTNPAEVAP